MNTARTKLNGTVTLLLEKASKGDAQSQTDLFHLVKRELHAIARRQLGQERKGHTLQATLLMDEAVLRLIGKEPKVPWENRQHFFRTAARAMRNILIDHERRRRAVRRGGNSHQRIAIDPNKLAEESKNIDLLALNEALEKLGHIDQRQSEIVELHHFGGFTLDETAELLGVSKSTIRSEWRLAKAFLYRELSRD